MRYGSTHEVTMNTALLLISSVVGQQHCPTPYPHYYQPFYYGNPYITRMPTPTALRPPAFTTRPANVPDRRTPADSVKVPPSVYQGVGPLVIENPYYKPSK